MFITLCSPSTRKMDQFWSIYCWIFITSLPVLSSTELQTEKIVRVEAGKIIDLDCDDLMKDQAQNPAQYVYIWRLNGEKVSQGPKMRLQPSRIETLSYELLVQYGTQMPSKVCSVQLIVEAPIHIEEVKAGLVGDHIEISCIVSGSHVTDIQWRNFGVNQGNIDPQEELKVAVGSYSFGQLEARQNVIKIWRKPNSGKLVDLLRHLDGKYKCKASGNVAGKRMYRTSDYIPLYYGPLWIGSSDVVITHIGDTNVKLNCEFSSNPPIRSYVVTWSFRDGQLPSNVTIEAGILSIGHVTEQHLGIYTCSVKNTDFNITLSAINDQEKQGGSTFLDSKNYWKYGIITLLVIMFIIAVSLFGTVLFKRIQSRKSQANGKSQNVSENELYDEILYDYIPNGEVANNTEGDTPMLIPMVSTEPRPTSEAPLYLFTDAHIRLRSSSEPMLGNNTEQDDFDTSINTKMSSSNSTVADQDEVDGFISESVGAAIDGRPIGTANVNYDSKGYVAASEISTSGSEENDETRKSLQKELEDSPNDAECMDLSETQFENDSVYTPTPRSSTAPDPYIID